MNGEYVIKMIFFLIYHNQLTNFKISIFFFKYTLSFHGTHITCYIKSKLLYEFRIIVFFSFQIYV